MFPAVFDDRRKDRICDILNRTFKDLSRNCEKRLLDSS